MVRQPRRNGGAHRCVCRAARFSRRRQLEETGTLVERFPGLHVALGLRRRKTPARPPAPERERGTQEGGSRAEQRDDDHPRGHRWLREWLDRCRQCFAELSKSKVVQGV
eukprot:5895215-Prymnesium_polylepis.1